MSKTKAELEGQVEELVTQVDNLQAEIADLGVALETAQAGNDAEIPEHGSNAKLTKAERQAQLATSG